ncbi:MAG: hypothetical protein CM1200mP33_5860 [Chloroflexota bacterium]|nr:MAG: hypothetical protein CM1200mP33_5860 [Chloroflexota bacterium]
MLTPSLSGINYNRLEVEGEFNGHAQMYLTLVPDFYMKKIFQGGSKAKFYGYKQGPRADEMPNGKISINFNHGKSSLSLAWGKTITKRSEYLLSKSPKFKEVSLNPKDGRNLA